MRAGKLRDTIHLLLPVENEAGEATDDYTVHASPRAEVLDKSGSLDSSTGSDQNERTIIIKLRFRSDLTEQMLVNLDDEVYRISHIKKDRKRRWLELTCIYQKRQHEYSITSALRVEAAVNRYEGTVENLFQDEG